MKTQRLKNIFWLGLKELQSLGHDIVLLLFVVYAFSLSIYSMGTGVSHELHRAPIAIVDEDRSQLSNRLADAFLPPYFQPPDQIAFSEIDAAMDSGRYTFILDIPPNFEADVVAGRQPELQVNIDATAIMQAFIGATYIQNILTEELIRFTGDELDLPLTLLTRTAFNPNHESSWFTSVMGIVEFVTLLTLALSGAALIREREHGTIEHLLVMPLSPFEIMLAKVWANALVIIIAVAASLLIVVQQILHVPIAGSVTLFLTGTMLYLFFAAAFGIFLGTIAKSMPQLGLLVIIIVLPMNLLSGGLTPIESQPAWLQSLTVVLPSRHFVSFAQSILYRGAGIEIVWPQFVAIIVAGLSFFGLALLRFRRMITSIS